MADTPKMNKNQLVFFAAMAAALILAAGWYVSQPKNDATVPSAPAPIEATSGQQALDKAAEITDADRADPSEADPAPQEFKPTTQPDGRFIGSKDAPVHIIEFASLSCSHCAHFHNKVLDEFRVKYVDTGKVRIEFRSFPLNQQALDGAKLLSCLPEDQYYPFMTMLFQTQDHWAFRGDYREILKQNAKLAGLADDKIETCLSDKKYEEEFVQGVIKDVQKYQLQSTPTFVLNDGAAKVVGAGNVDDLGKEIAPLLDGTAKASSQPETLAPATSESTPAP